MLYLLFDLQAAGVQSVIQANQEKTVAIAAQRAAAGLKDVYADLRYLAARPGLRDVLAAPQGGAPPDLAADLRMFAQQKAIYDQIRLIDRTGQERLRIDWNDGAPAQLPPDRLQNKADRYYFDEIMSRAAGGIYVSPFDLNVEHGDVETEPRPVIRFGTPVVDEAGRHSGLVVLNLLGRPLLDDIAAVTSEVPGQDQTWLLNADGYWLLGPSPEVEWAFMYPDRPQRSFADTYPVAWQRLRQGPPSGQVLTAGGLFTYARLSPGDELALSRPMQMPAPTWILVSFLPAAILTQRRRDQAMDFIPVAVVLALLLAALSLAIARNSISRQQAEAHLRASEERFRALLESAPDAVVITDPDGRIVLVNAQTERLFGHPRARLLGQAVELLVPPDLRERHAGHRDSFVAAARVREMGAGLDLLGLRADGTTFPVAISLSPVRTDGGLLIVADIRDISERKVAEQRRLASETRFRALLESAPDAIVITDTDGRIVLVNAQTERLFGYARERLIGAEVEILVPEAQRTRHEAHRRGYLKEPRVREMGAGQELQGLRADGSRFPVAISLSPVRTDQELLIVADIRDISDRQQTERQIQALNRQLSRDNAELAALNRELEAFSYSVSHDLRAPLRAIDGFSQALIEDCADQLDPDGRQHLQRVRQAAQRMGQLIDDLLKLSRVSRQELNVRQVDLGSMARGILAGLQAEAPGRVAEFDIADGLLAEGDARLLQIALENLLGNAWKFTAGRPVVRIAFGSEIVDGETVYHVRDNGAGFDMAYADQLFRAFQRLHSGLDFPGTGIGLATVQRIIHKHNGRIWADAVPDEGATFRFTL